jgi:hypothetical protein
MYALVIVFAYFLAALFLASRVGKFLSSTDRMLRK